MGTAHESVGISEEDGGIAVLTEVGGVVCSGETWSTSDDDTPAQLRIGSGSCEHLWEVVPQLRLTAPRYEEEHLLTLYGLGMLSEVGELSIDTRVTYILGAKAAVAEVVRLEGQDTQPEVYIAAELAYAPCSPRPELGEDIVDDGAA